MSYRQTGWAATDDDKAVRLSERALAFLTLAIGIVLLLAR